MNTNKQTARSTYITECLDRCTEQARAAVADLIEAVDAALNQDQVELPGWLTERLSSAAARCQHELQEDRRPRPRE